jgi:tetratricopeptide (TPR) repeat protein
LSAVLPVLLLPVFFIVAAVLITLARRWYLRKQNPQRRFNRPIWRSSLDTMGFLLILWAVPTVLLSNIGLGNPAPHIQFINWFSRNLLWALLILLGVGVMAYLALLYYVIYSIKPILYRGDHEKALRTIRWWRTFPVISLLTSKMLAEVEGGILVFGGHYAEAEKLIRAMLPAKDNTVRKAQGMRLDNLGWSVMRQGRYSEAIAIFEDSIAKYPEGSDNFSGLGETYLRQGLFPEQAKDYLDRGIENKRYRMDVDAYVWGELLANRAWALAQLGSCDEARHSLAQALAETEKNCIPALAGLHWRGANVMRLCGTEAEVQEYLQQAIKTDAKGAYGQLAQRMSTEQRETHGTV